MKKRVIKDYKNVYTMKEGKHFGFKNALLVISALVIYAFLSLLIKELIK